jgi:hypothetical protein
MGCNDNGQNGGCRLSQADIDALASQITNKVNNIPINTTVTIEGSVPLINGKLTPVVGTTITSLNDMFEGENPTLNKNKLKDLLCDIAAKAENDVKFKKKFDPNSPTYNIIIRIIVKGQSEIITLPYPGPVRNSVHTQAP